MHNRSERSKSSADQQQVIYDNNQITCDGSVDLTNTEDVNKKMEACGWDIIDVEDGINDVEAIVAAMEKGRDPNRTKPLFINVRSIIGVGSASVGTNTRAANRAARCC